MSKYTKEEKETIINATEADKTASVYSCSGFWIRKMEKLMKAFPDKVILEERTETGATFSVPKSWIKIRPPRAMTDEQRQKAAERLREIRENHKKEN